MGKDEFINAVLVEMIDTLDTTQLAKLKQTLHIKLHGLQIDKEITVHTLRKTFASKLSRKGCKPSIIAKLLGHTSIDTTLKYYILINDNDIKWEHERCIS